jgi:hypothetical protein
MGQQLNPEARAPAYPVMFKQVLCRHFAPIPKVHQANQQQIGVKYSNPGGP